MMEVLGFKRIVFIASLALLCGALAAALYGYLEPELVSVEKNVKTEQLRENTVRGDIANIKMEFEQLALQQNQFDGLRAEGFFSNQSRRDAQVIFAGAEKLSGVNEAIVTVRPGRVVENENAAKANHIILESPVEITIRSIDDVDVFEYLTYLKDNFPGFLSMDNISMSRQANISNTILRAIATGANPPLVESKIQMTWRTMVERGNYVDDTQDGVGGL